MARLMLTDELWSKLKMIMLQHRIYDKPNLRIMVEGMFYRLRVGCPWRDLPAEFGYWNSIFQKFNRWSSKNILNKIFKSLVQDPDLEWEFIDGSIVRAHQHSTGAIGEENQAIGRPEVEIQQKYIWLLMPVAFLLSLTLPVVKFMTVKLLRNRETSYGRIHNCGQRL